MLITFTKIEHYLEFFKKFPVLGKARKIKLFSFRRGMIEVSLWSFQNKAFKQWAWM